MTTDKQLEFTTLHGGLLSLDFLQELVASKRVPDGPALSGELFGLAPSEQLNNYIAGQYTRLRELWQLAQQAPEAAQPTLYASLRDALLDALGFKERQLLPTPEDPSIQQPSGLLAQHDVVLWSLHAPQDVKRPLDEARPYGLTSSPHSMLQTFLNHEETFLWGILCDGHRLRLLRDHYSMTRQAFIEWDLDAIFEQSNPYDFEALMLVAHVTSLAQLHPEDPARIEQWRQAAQKTGSRALEALEGCVRAAIEHLGAGLVRHVKNQQLHKALREGSLSTQQLHHALLRLIYRLIFLLVAESRDVLLPRDADPLARQIYEEEYALSALIPRARRLRGSPHADLWARITKIFAWLDEGQPALALPALGSSLWHPEFIVEPVRSAYIGNDDVLAALRALCFRFDEQTQQLQRVNWRAIGAEELGSVYESLLAYHPVLNTVDREFHLKTAHGNDRKTSGAYYTPSSLVELLLKSALDPVIQRTLDAHAAPEARAAALLNLTICDPACGSGHFLVAAAHRLARHVAQAQSGESEPPPSVYQHALREVIARCVHGVDINPMAVELCKVSLWMESMEPGKPLAFLDAHIQLGNSLLGVTPALLKNPIPADAWSALEGDDKERVKLVAKRHKQEVSKDAHASATPSSATPKKGGKAAKKAAPLLLEVYAEEQAAQTGSVYARAVLDAMRNHLDAARQVLIKLADDTRQAIGEVEQGWRSYLAGEVYQRNKQVADTWCAAFVWPLATDEDVALAPTHDRWRELIEPAKRPAPGTPEAARLDAMLARVAELAKEFRFFHWHLAFPHVFGLPTEDTPSGRSGGFDVILGNPPWEKVKIMQVEWFAQRIPYIAESPNKADRLKRIDEMAAQQHPAIAEFYLAKRASDGEAEFLRKSGIYPLCGVGSVNTYAVFSELILNLTGSTGRSGFIVPSGIATDDTTKLYFQYITQQRALATLYDFENKGLFEKVHSSFKFSLLTLVAPGAGPHEIELAFFLHDPAELEREGDDSPVIHLTAADITRINPNTNTCPILRSSRDAHITREVYGRVPVLIEEATETRPEKNAWGVDLGRMFHMSEDSHLFNTREQLEGDGWTLQGNRFVRGADVMLPLYEAKMIHHYTHRWASYEGVVGGGADDEALSTRDLSLDELRDPSALPRPRYWVASSEVEAKLEGKWDKQWLMGWRDITNATNERTVIASVIPKTAVGHTTPLFLGHITSKAPANLETQLTSFIFDYTTRQKIGGTHLTYGYLKQLPVLPPQTFDEKRAWAGDETLAEWIKPRVVELTYTAWDMEPFARDCGDEGAPFVWDEARRFQLRAELDAAMFHLYGIGRDDVDYIMSTFPIVERRDRKASATEDSPEGRYLTRDAILAVYDRMAAGEVIAYGEGARHAMR